MMLATTQVPCHLYLPIRLAEYHFHAVTGAAFAQKISSCLYRDVPNRTNPSFTSPSYSALQHRRRYRTPKQTLVDFLKGLATFQQTNSIDF